MNALNEKEAAELFDRMVAGTMSDEEIAAILREMAGRGESVSEIVGMARGMRRHAIKIGQSPNGKAQRALLDTCGTGGSGLPRMNISTVAAFVLSACGVTVAKHGNKAASGRTGSFDLIEALGVRIDLSPEHIESALVTTNLAFIYAPLFHPEMKRIAPVRKALGIRTIFNLIGPLCNPASPAYHLLGTPSKELAEKMAHAMKELAYEHAMVVSGSDGLDEVTVTGPTNVYELQNGCVRSYTIKPEDFGISRAADFSCIAGGSAKKNARLCMDLLAGKGRRSLSDLLLMNCACALVVSGAAATIDEGIIKAREGIESGAALEKFNAYRNFSITLNHEI